MSQLCNQVCGLKWSPDDRELASGGNDNQLFIWGVNNTAPQIRFSEHQAAVKAIAWSPHQHGLIASGGGTADRRIRFWNTVTSSSVNSIDTGEAEPFICLLEPAKQQSIPYSGFWQAHGLPGSHRPA